MEFIVVFHIAGIARICYTPKYGKPEHIKGGLPSVIGGANPQTKERRATPMYVTYQDLVQIGIFIVALVSLLYQIFKGRK